MARVPDRDPVIDLGAALRAVVEVLDDAGVDYLVVGSVAAAAWGVTRMTRDVDTVARLTLAGLEQLTSRLDPAAFYLPQESAREAVRTGGTFNVLHLPTGGKVDLFVVPASDAFTRSRLDRRVRAEGLGVETWVATPEDVVLAKLRWRLESRSEVQWRDCVEIVAVNPVDVGYLHSWASQLGVAEDLEELLAVAS
jgi:hypothetical protein